ncbi:MAG: RES domain-containing protein [Verrucomicrobiota bacterium]
MEDKSRVLSRLASAPVRRLRAELVRCVALAPLTEAAAPDYLFASGRANRYNPAGVPCVYFSENEQTARAEYGRRLGRVAKQPLATFFAEVDLARVLDLTDEPTWIWQESWI